MTRGNGLETRDIGRIHPDLVVSSAIVAIILLDRFIVIVRAVPVPEELRIQNVVLSVLILLLHIWVTLRIVRKRNPTVLFVLHIVFLAIYAVSVWESGAIVAALLVYTVTLGVHVVEPLVMIGVGAAWTVCVAALARYPSLWDAPEVPAPGSDLRGLLYVMLVLCYLCHNRLRLHRSRAGQRREIINLRASVEELTAANMSYNTFVQMAESQAARHERSRITREIHDGVGYALTNLIMLAESTKDLLGVDPGIARARLATIRNQAKLALSDTRRALRELRKAEQGLIYGQAALIHMMDVFQHATGVEARREFLIPESVLEGERIFPVVYRFVQEALTNSFRHGKASRVMVRFWQVERDLVVSVSDDGNAPEVLHEGIGLQGMRERLGEVGGELSYHTLRGFTVTARLPIAWEEGGYV